jgi:hypothetical protein
MTEKQLRKLIREELENKSKSTLNEDSTTINWFELIPELEESSELLDQAQQKIFYVLSEIDGIASSREVNTFNRMSSQIRDIKNKLDKIIDQFD